MPYRLLLQKETFLYGGFPVQLRVLPSPAFHRFTRDASTGGTSFEVTAEPGFTYQVHASDDLTNWVYVSTLEKFNGSARVTDVEAGSFRARFYRLVIVGD